MREKQLFSAFVVVLLSLTVVKLARPAPVPKGKLTVRLVQAGKLKVENLVVADAAVIDDNQVAIVGRKGDIDDAPPPTNEGDPNGAIVDLARKSARPFTNQHTAQIWGVSVFGDRLLTGSTNRDPFLRVWDLKAQKSIEAIKIDKADNLGATCPVRCFHKNNRVVVGTLERLIVFNPTDSKDRIELACPPTVEWLSDEIAISPDDAWIACTADQGHVVFWEVATRKATTVSLIPKDVNNADKWSAEGVVFSLSGKLFAWRSGNSDEVPKGKAEKEVPAEQRGVVRIDLPDGKVVPLGTGHTVYTHGCAIDPKGTWLATAGSSRLDKPRPDGTTNVGELRIYNLPSKELAYREQVEGLPLKWVSFTPSGKRIVCATLDGVVRWWDVSAP